MKPDEIFFKIYEDMIKVYDSPNEAYEAAEDFFGEQTAKGFGRKFRKYPSFEVFYQAYARKSKKWS